MSRTRQQPWMMQATAAEAMLISKSGELRDEKDMKGSDKHKEGRGPRRRVGRTRGSGRGEMQLPKITEGSSQLPPFSSCLEDLAPGFPPAAPLPAFLLLFPPFLPFLAPASQSSSSSSAAMDSAFPPIPHCKTTAIRRTRPEAKQQRGTSAAAVLRHIRTLTGQKSWTKAEFALNISRISETSRHGS